MARILRGEIRWADLNPVRGSEAAGKRPVLIHQSRYFQRAVWDGDCIGTNQPTAECGIPARVRTSVQGSSKEVVGQDESDTDPRGRKDRFPARQGNSGRTRQSGRGNHGNHRIVDHVRHPRLRHMYGFRLSLTTPIFPIGNDCKYFQFQYMHGFMLACS